jgi:hypothetical protein
MALQKTTISVGLDPLSAKSPPCRTRSGEVSRRSARTASNAVRLPWMSDTIAMRTDCDPSTSLCHGVRTLTKSCLVLTTTPGLSEQAGGQNCNFSSVPRTKIKSWAMSSAVLRPLLCDGGINGCVLYSSDTGLSTKYAVNSDRSKK